MIPIYVGYDLREAVAYHTFCQSVITRSTQPISFTPLALNTLFGYQEAHEDGSNSFIYSRFLVPCFQDYQGWALFVDGDMVCLSDISKLWDLRDERYAVMVVKHDYKTKHSTKYLGAKNDDYPMKNWSSVILWNCAHPANRVLTMDYVSKSSGSVLHRFEHLESAQIGEIPLSWNWLAIEYGESSARPDLVHYTLGTPCFDDYADKNLSVHWHREHLLSQKGIGV